jgi:hypothetical protein
MATAFDYRQMARECLKEAAATKDVGRREALRDIAKLYSQTALNMEGSSQDNEQSRVRASGRA